MKQETIISKRSLSIAIIALFAATSLLLFFLYKERYLQCITFDLSMCVRSKKYSSQNGEFIFRYPDYYPLTYKTGIQMHEEYLFDKDRYDEYINFSTEFYPGAGGDCLATVVVTFPKDAVNLEQYKKTILSDYEKWPDMYKSTLPKLDIVSVGGKDALHQSIGRQPHSFDPPAEIYTTFHNGKQYTIGFYYSAYYHKLPISNYEKGRRLILNTFTFTK